jgi:hypothetical protein
MSATKTMNINLMFTPRPYRRSAAVTSRAALNSDAGFQPGHMSEFASSRPSS